MLFRRGRAEKLARQLQEHLDWIERLQSVRLDELRSALRLGSLSEFAQRQVLALNFELASHASRASVLLRQIEEVTTTDIGRW